MSWESKLTVGRKIFPTRIKPRILLRDSADSVHDGRWLTFFPSKCSAVELAAWDKQDRDDTVTLCSAPSHFGVLLQGCPQVLCRWTAFSKDPPTIKSFTDQTHMESKSYIVPANFRFLVNKVKPKVNPIKDHPPCSLPPPMAPRARRIFHEV